MTDSDPFKFRLEDIPPTADRSKLESPLEVMFIETLEKYLSGKAEIVPQYEIVTLAGKFRLDFLLTVGEQKIGFECDGKEFHDEWRDEWRDALILGSGEIDTIYRFRGSDLYLNMDDCIYLIYHNDKALFSGRYEIIARQLISDELKEKLATIPQFDSESTTVGYPLLTENGEHMGWRNIKVGRRNKNDKRGQWNSLFEVARQYLGYGLDKLIEIREKSWKH